MAGPVPLETLRPRPWLRQEPDLEKSVLPLYDPRDLEEAAGSPLQACLPKLMVGDVFAMLVHPDLRKVFAGTWTTNTSLSPDDFTTWPSFTHHLRHLRFHCVPEASSEDLRCSVIAEMWEHPSLMDLVATSTTLTLVGFYGPEGIGVWGQASCPYLESSLDPRPECDYIFLRRGDEMFLLTSYGASNATVFRTMPMSFVQR